MYNEYKALKALGKVSIDVDGTQPVLSRIYHDSVTGEFMSPRIDAIDVDYLSKYREVLLNKIKDIEALVVDVTLALERKAGELAEPKELP